MRGGESMLIKKITLRNFRQYMNTEIIFSTDPEKNITLIKETTEQEKQHLHKHSNGFYMDIQIFRFKN